ncbi:MAG: hypothetical protein H3C35_07985 [Bacteroidetes bacterium]|nr:hypothetical protein [Bacteroidota bacterium]
MNKNIVRTANHRRLCAVDTTVIIVSDIYAHDVRKRFSGEVERQNTQDVLQCFNVGSKMD